MSRVLTASFRDLCEADHQDDPERIAVWTADKSPGQIRAWFGGCGCYWLAERNGEAEAVGGLEPGGTIALLYVLPSAAGQGAGSGMLSHLETELHGAGRSEGRLNANRTARSFFLKHGWQQLGGSAEGRGTPCTPMRKSLT
ncbi:GNAT family N-acetyltransferase [Leisingera thetidis]|uniref:GNAT family N-acetyltransferase n=1 Tax=Leisingera thetidis TaxID=2930199 RepID=UPI0021F74BE4|nr:GNAT family N-acetyltransferase [Leisingera thetidis]